MNCDVIAVITFFALLSLIWAYLKYIGPTDDTIVSIDKHYIQYYVTSNGHILGLAFHKNLNDISYQ